MSTKLWNGLILRNRSLEQAFEVLTKLRETGRQLMERALVARYAEAFALDADLPLNFHELDRPLLTRSRIMHLIREAERDERLDYDQRSADLDFILRMTLCPKDPDVLALHHDWTGLGYRQALMQAGFEDYHYLDQTDCSADVTEEEWDQRGADWLACHDGQYGLNFEMVTWHDIQQYGASITGAMMRDAIPTETLRRERIAAYLADYDKGEPRSIWGPDQHECYLQCGELEETAVLRLPAIRLRANIQSLPFMHGDEAKEICK